MDANKQTKRVLVSAASVLLLVMGSGGEFQGEVTGYVEIDLSGSLFCHYHSSEFLFGYSSQPDIRYIIPAGVQLVFKEQRPDRYHELRISMPLDIVPGEYGLVSGDPETASLNPDVPRARLVFWAEDDERL